jgi:hypothetical protein
MASQRGGICWVILQLLQERGETFRDRLFDGTVIGLEPLPDCQQPRPPGQDVIAFLARGQLPFRPI